MPTFKSDRPDARRWSQTVLDLAPGEAPDRHLARLVRHRQVGHVATARRDRPGAPQASVQGSALLRCPRVDPCHVAQTPMTGSLGHRLPENITLKNDMISRHHHQHRVTPLLLRP